MNFLSDLQIVVANLLINASAATTVGNAIRFLWNKLTRTQALFAGFLFI